MKKSAITPKYSEIRAALIGWVRYEGLYCVAVEDIRQTAFSGLNNGATAARILGLKQIDREYVAPPDASVKIEPLYQDILKKIKRNWLCKYQLFYVVNEPDALAFLIRPLITNPVVVVLNPEKNRVHAEYYTARGLFSGLHLKRMIRKFAKTLPDNLVVEDKKEKKDEKK